MATIIERQVGSGGLSLWRRLYRAVEYALRLRAERRVRQQLARLSDTTLKDLGLNRGDLERELARPLWEAVDWNELERQRRLNGRPEARP